METRKILGINALVWLVAIGFTVAPADAQRLRPGGFMDSATSAGLRAQFSAGEIQTFLPDRGTFTFPSPYFTQGVRVTNASDCGGTDCVRPVGYSYWSNINNHVGSDTMLIFLGLERRQGGGGPTLFSYNKRTGQVRNEGPLFPGDSSFSWATGEGWYFSAKQPTMLYVNVPAASTLQRYDVVSHALTTVFDVASRPDLFGTNRYIWQFHSSDDDRVHSATLKDGSTYADLGCLVYREDTKQFSYLPQKGLRYDECQIDKSGRWLVIKEKIGTDPASEVDDRVIDLQSGAERDLLDRNGAGGHSDNGFGYLVASDNYNSLPGAVRLWDFNLDLAGRRTAGVRRGTRHAGVSDDDLGHRCRSRRVRQRASRRADWSAVRVQRQCQPQGVVARERNPLLPAGWIARRPGRRAQSHQPRCLRRRERRLREASEG